MSQFSHGFITLLFATACSFGFPRPTYAQEPGHTEPKSSVRAPKEAEVLSFAKYEPMLRQICEEMARDGRRTRLADIADREGKSYEACPSCRALWRSVDRACRNPAEGKGSAAYRRPKKTPTADPAETAPEETPVPTPVPRYERYPSPATLDLTSRLSDSFYSSDSSEPIKRAVDHLQKTLEHEKDLTPGERDYYGIFLTYLLSAWQGRENSERRPTPRREELNGLFE